MKCEYTRFAISLYYLQMAREQKFLESEVQSGYIDKSAAANHKTSLIFLKNQHLFTGLKN